MSKRVIESAEYFSSAYPDANRGLTTEQLKGNGCLEGCTQVVYTEPGNKVPFENYTDDLDAKWLAATNPSFGKLFIDMIRKFYGKDTE